MIHQALRKLTTFENLTSAEVEDLMVSINSGELTDTQIAGLLVALLMKGPTVEEIAAIASSMRQHCTQVSYSVEGRIIDTCGTGGGQATFNVSTGVAITAAAAGIPVAKHGSRSLSSLSGSADVLESLGVRISLTPEEAKAMLEQIGITFLYAPNFHPIMHRVLPPEQELGIKTIFYTIIGPLINPAGARSHLLGVYLPELVDQVSAIIQELDFVHAMVVHGLDGYDEISLVGKSDIAEVKNGVISRYQIEPEDFGIARCQPEAIKGGTPAENAQVLRDIFLGQEHGPKRDLLLLNSAGAMVVGGKTSDLKEGLVLAREIIDSGKALDKLEQLIERSHSPFAKAS